MARCRVCECCGANLDFGERCDCRDQCRQENEASSSEGGVKQDGAEECNTH